MYKLLLCLRYLRSKYIALASIISVTLGVATLIVVNSVMLGFTSEMEKRLHGNTSDIIVTSRSLDGIVDPESDIDYIMKHLGDKIEAITPIISVPAMLSYRIGSGDHHKAVLIVGIDPNMYGNVCDMKQNLQHPDNQENPDFILKEKGYTVRTEKAVREELEIAGFYYRRKFYEQFASIRAQEEEIERKRLEKEQQNKINAQKSGPGFETFSPDLTHLDAAIADNTDRVNGNYQSEDPTAPYINKKRFDPREEQHTGIYLGYPIARISSTISETEVNKKKKPLNEDTFCLIPGDDVSLTFPTAGSPPTGTTERFTVVDLFDSGFVEYDENVVFVPLADLQRMRGMIDPMTGRGRATEILIKVKNDNNTSEKEIADKLSEMFPKHLYLVQTWQEKHQQLIFAVQMEVAILNVLLFLIIAVAGFGILAIFYMIVVEKTKDIGIMKSLGASGPGVMQIFLFYSISLGLLGAGLGTLLGMIIIWNIQAIANFLTGLTGQQVFDPSIYPLYEIPTIVRADIIFGVIIATLAIAVTAGILPAIRAARMHPVEALRT